MNRHLSKIVVFGITTLVNGAAFAASPSMPIDSAGELLVTSTDFVGKDIGKRNCIRQTGSHIVFKDGRACNGQIGSAYTRDDIDRTGAITTAGALQSLDTAVQFRR